MSEEEHSKISIVLEYYEKAIELYFEDAAPYVVLHLAGAAEEISGAYIKSLNRSSDHPYFLDVSTAFEDQAEGAVRISTSFSEGGARATVDDFKKLMNNAKNNIKHGHGEFRADIKQESFNTLKRCQSNLEKLGIELEIPESEIMLRFKTHNPGVGWLQS